MHLSTGNIQAQFTSRDLAAAMHMVCSLLLLPGERPDANRLLQSLLEVFDAGGGLWAEIPNDTQIAPSKLVVREAHRWGPLHTDVLCYNRPPAVQVNSALVSRCRGLVGEAMREFIWSYRAATERKCSVIALHRCRPFDERDAALLGNLHSLPVFAPCRDGEVADNGLILSSRQQQVLVGLTRGRSEKQIAQGLNLSHHTVHVHVKAIYRRLGVRTRHELLRRTILLEERRTETQMRRRSIMNDAEESSVTL